ncbi:MAG: hypothetical protein QOH88_933 [Verrucomicrobiota bacterium]|jgi:hypothetical protein
MPNKKKPAAKKPNSAPSSGVASSVKKVLQKHKELGLELEKLRQCIPDDPHFDK